jgi:hypothetical protein
MAKKNRRNKRVGDAAMDTSSGVSASSVLPSAGIPKPSNKRKGILKLSRKQKVRKQARKDRAEAVVDRVSAKGVRDAKKLNRKLAAKALW